MSLTDAGGESLRCDLFSGWRPCCWKGKQQACLDANYSLSKPHLQTSSLLPLFFKVELWGGIIQTMSCIDVVIELEPVMPVGRAHDSLWCCGSCRSLPRQEHLFKEGLQGWCVKWDINICVCVFVCVRDAQHKSVIIIDNFLFALLQKKPKQFWPMNTSKAERLHVKQDEKKQVVVNRGNFEQYNLKLLQILIQNSKMYYSNTIKCLQNRLSMNKTGSTTVCFLSLCQAVCSKW